MAETTPDRDVSAGRPAGRIASERILAGGTPLTVAQPNGKPRAGIVIVQEAWGITGHIDWLATIFAGAGYLAAAPHLYHRSGDQVIEDHDFAKARPVMSKLSGDTIAEDIGNATAFLRASGASKVGIIGFCMGGTIALWAAAHADVDAAVTFYGSGIAESRWPGIESGLETAASVRVPWLGLYGDKDKSIPVDQVESLRPAMEPVNAPTQIVRYPTAGHAFASAPDSPRHVREAAEDAGIRTREFLAAHL